MIILFSYPLKSRALENATFYLQSDKDNVIIGDEFEVSLNLKGINTSAYSIEIFFEVKEKKIKKVESTRFYSGNLLNSIAKQQEAKFSPPVFIILSMFQT